MHQREEHLLRSDEVLPRGFLILINPSVTVICDPQKGGGGDGRQMDVTRQVTIHPRKD